MKVFLFFLRMMNYFVALIIIATWIYISCKKSGHEIVSTLLPSVMTLNVLAILQPKWQNNLGASFSDFKFKFSNIRYISTIGTQNKVKYGFFSINITIEKKILD